MSHIFCAFLRKQYAHMRGLKYIGRIGHRGLLMKQYAHMRGLKWKMWCNGRWKQWKQYAHMRGLKSAQSNAQRLRFSKQYAHMRGLKLKYVMDMIKQEVGSNTHICVDWNSGHLLLDFVRDRSNTHICVDWNEERYYHGLSNCSRQRTRRSPWFLWQIRPLRWYHRRGVSRIGRIAKRKGWVGQPYSA